MYPVLGLAEEAGEFAGKWAKFIRKHGGRLPMLPGCPASMEDSGCKIASDEFREAASKELGDVLWMVAECCTILGLPLEFVMRSNIDKLADRRNRGVIVGEGDNR